MSIPPRDFESWMAYVNRTLNDVKRNGQAAVAGQIKREIAKVEEQIVAGGGDGRTPAAPIELEVQTSTFVDSTRTLRGRLTVDFPDVTVASDASPMEIIGYELWIADWTDYVGVGPEPTLQWNAASIISSVTSEVLTPGGVYKARVRAISGTSPHPGLFSEAWSGQIVKDTVPPPIPRQFIGEARLGVAILNWNGQSSASEPMPADFSHTETQLSIEFGPYFDISGSLDEAGQLFDSTPPFDASARYRHRAVDLSGNASGWSVAEELILTKLVDDEALRLELDAVAGRIDEVGRDVGNIGTELTARLETAETNLAASQVRLTGNEEALASAFNDIFVANGTANTAYSLAGTKARVVVSESDPPGNITGYKVGDLWRKHNAGKEVIGEWQVEGTAWVKQTVSGSRVSNMDIGYLTAGSATITQAVINKLVAATASFQTVDVKNLFATNATMQTAVINKLWTEVVNSRLITAEMIAVGSMTNVIRNPIFAKNAEGWTLPSTASLATQTGPDLETVIEVFHASAATSVVTSPSFPVTAGDSYAFSAKVKAFKNMPLAGISLLIYRRLAGGSGFVGQVGVSADPIPASGLWIDFEFDYKVPQDVVELKFGFQVNPSLGNAYAYMTAPMARLRAGGRLIVDGAIEAQHITASASLSAKVGKFLTVKTDMLEANAVTAGKIEFGSLNGVMITGMQIQTDAAANRGVKITNNGIRAYDPDSGFEVFNLSATNGQITAHGGTFTGSTFQTAASGARVVMNDSTLTAYSATNAVQFRLGSHVNGLEVRDPNNGALRPLADIAFGLTYLTWTPIRVLCSQATVELDQLTTIARTHTVPSNSIPSNWVYDTIQTFTVGSAGRYLITIGVKGYTHQHQVGTCSVEVTGATSIPIGTLMNKYGGFPSTISPVLNERGMGFSTSEHIVTLAAGSHKIRTAIRLESGIVLTKWVYAADRYVKIIAI